MWPVLLIRIDLHEPVEKRPRLIHRLDVDSLVEAEHATTIGVGEYASDPVSGNSDRKLTGPGRASL